MSILKNSNKFKKGKFENIEIEFNLEENSTSDDNSIVKKFNEIYFNLISMQHGIWRVSFKHYLNVPV